MEDRSNSIIVDILISAEDYLQHYQGSVSQVSALARDGRRVRFPSRILQPFVSKEGIHGTFAIQFDEHHKFAGIEKIS
ncbi:DUF2835 domain-containing protein [Reinekea thalattae]|uniref:DUF2835 family protein n=1 Tax=Reinekea thalattae TaxID=2593301 RepID=A0A5C8Z9L5_9GAMM|nr:DUF2835 domain-containing protein [Reinekea thalattae]TXR53556.1 DUF2835 family protein [Reinekea thalattae]